jgi:hypothetical protein
MLIPGSFTPEDESLANLMPAKQPRQVRRVYDLPRTLEKSESVGQSRLDDPFNRAQPYGVRANPARFGRTLF